jgi:hypothetical protein
MSLTNKLKKGKNLACAGLAAGVLAGSACATMSLGTAIDLYNFGDALEKTGTLSPEALMAASRLMESSSDPHIRQGAMSVREMGYMQYQRELAEASRSQTNVYVQQQQTNPVQNRTTNPNSHYFFSGFFIDFDGSGAPSEKEIFDMQGWGEDEVKIFSKEKQIIGVLDVNENPHHYGIDIYNEGGDKIYGLDTRNLSEAPGKSIQWHTLIDWLSQTHGNGRYKSVWTEDEKFIGIRDFEIRDPEK